MILRPNKPIEKCIVLYDGEKLPWWDNVEKCYYERFIDVGSGGNVRIPKGKKKDDAEVVVKDGKKTLRKRKFKEITEVPP